jgi:hypothetical protein
MNPTNLIIISGGQTGADRAALDWAFAHGVPHGGWCPKGRRAEDGQIPLRYQLRETPQADYAQRTEWNVRDSDATVIFSTEAKPTGGAEKTRGLARKQGRPLLHLTAADASDHASLLRVFVIEHRVERLNVAGPRASEESGVAAFVRGVLEGAFGAESEYE